MFKTLRDVQALTSSSSKKKTMLFIGVFFVAVILSTSLAISNIHSRVRAETSIPKPSVPEFTVNLIDSSYDVPTTYSIDPYTGDTVTHAGYHVECRTIEVKIKNQPFTPYKDENGSIPSFYYNIRIKGPFSENWIELYNPSVGYPAQDAASEYTVLTYQGEYSSTTGMKFESSSITIMTTFPPGAQVDFQVQALIGAVHRGYNATATNQLDMFPWVFDGEESGWSNTQTLTISESQTPNSSPANSPTPSQEPGQTDLAATIVGVAIVAVVLGAGVGLLVYLIKRK